jgi:uroporphyrinogen-III synthase
VRLGIRRAPLRLAALSQRIAAAAGDGWGEVAAAGHPDDKALLALARQMCQDPWPGGRTAG